MRANTTIQFFIDALRCSIRPASWPVVLAAAFLLVLGCNDSNSAAGGTGGSGGLDPALVEQGKEIFRHDTFGDEALWTDTLQLHTVIATAVDPLTALAVGLKVDAAVLPEGILDAVDLTDPATTVALLKLGAVVGVKGTVEEIDGIDVLTSVGITCASCHSTVDDSVIPGIGNRLDGWPNRDLNPGLILSLSPALQDPDTQAVLTSWGPGMYDAYWNQDGINNPQVIPPAYGLAGVDLETFTGEGPVSYWNSYVAVTQMGGLGTFIDERLGLNIVADPDLVTPKLEALRAYQLSLPAPPPPPGSFDANSAALGRILFEGSARCATCHTAPDFTDVSDTLHTPAEVGQDPTLAMRGTTGMYRTTPLRGVWQHPPYFHDGSAATLDDVVEHYDAVLTLELTEADKGYLVEYLRSL